MSQVHVHILHFCHGIFPGLLCPISGKEINLYHLCCFCNGFTDLTITQSYDEDAEDAEDHPMPNPVESILGIFLMSLGEFFSNLVFVYMKVVNFYHKSCSGDVGFIWEGVPNTNHELIGRKTVDNETHDNIQHVFTDVRQELPDDKLLQGRSTSSSSSRSW